jgi:hypothetical protein
MPDRSPGQLKGPTAGRPAHGAIDFDAAKKAGAPVIDSNGGDLPRWVSRPDASMMSGEEKRGLRAAIVSTVLRRVSLPDTSTSQ